MIVKTGKNLPMCIRNFVNPYPGPGVGEVKIYLKICDVIIHFFSGEMIKSIFLCRLCQQTFLPGKLLGDQGVH